MDTDRTLSAAARAEDLRRVARTFHRANDNAKRRRAELHDAVIDAVLLLGMTKSEAARISGYTREYVAKICDDRVRADQPES